MQCVRVSRINATVLRRGGVQVPSRIEGGAVVGQHKYRTRSNLPFGAGSQLASLAFPGDSA